MSELQHLDETDRAEIEVVPPADGSRERLQYELRLAREARARLATEVRQLRRRLDQHHVTTTDWDPKDCDTCGYADRHPNCPAAVVHECEQSAGVEGGTDE